MRFRPFVIKNNAILLASHKVALANWQTIFMGDGVGCSDAGE